MDCPGCNRSIAAFKVVSGEGDRGWGRGGRQPGTSEGCKLYFPAFFSDIYTEFNSENGIGKPGLMPFDYRLKNGKLSKRK